MPEGWRGSAVYWSLVELVGLALLVAMLIRRIHGVLWALLAMVGTGLIAGAFVVAYGRLAGA